MFLQEHFDKSLDKGVDLPSKRLISDRNVPSGTLAHFLQQVTQQEFSSTPSLCTSVLSGTLSQACDCSPRILNVPAGTLVGRALTPPNPVSVPAGTLGTCFAHEFITMHSSSSLHSIWQRIMLRVTLVSPY